MKIMIAGAGSVGRSIAKEMTVRKHEVTIVDRNPQAMRVASVPLADWILADASEVSTLREIDLDSTDVVVAATGDDRANLVVSLLAKTEFGVPRVIARVNNPANEWLFDEGWGVDVPVSTPKIMASFIEDAMTEGQLIRRIDFYEPGAGLFQGTISENSTLIETAVRDIELPPDSFISAIIRDGVPIPADPDAELGSGDQLLIIVGAAGGDTVDAIQALLAGPQGE